MLVLDSTMQRTLTYLLAFVLFIACAMNDEIIPGNISESMLGFVKRNIQKNRSELFEDMRQIAKQGLIHFEVYNESGKLVKVLKDSSDFNDDFQKSFNNSQMLIKSVSQVGISLNTELLSPH